MILKKFKKIFPRKFGNWVSASAKTIPSSVWCFWKKEEESFDSVEQQKKQQKKQQQQQCFEFFCLLLENQKQWGAEAAAMF
jgi:hypothetical protein